MFYAGLCTVPVTSKVHRSFIQSCRCSFNRWLRGAHPAFSLTSCNCHPISAVASWWVCGVQSQALDKLTRNSRWAAENGECVRRRIIKVSNGGRGGRCMLVVGQRSVLSSIRCALTTTTGQHIPPVYRLSGPPTLSSDTLPLCRRGMTWPRPLSPRFVNHGHITPIQLLYPDILTVG